MRTLGRMILGRLLYDRGPGEFDTFRFATKPVSLWNTYLPSRERYELQAAIAPRSERVLEENKLLFWALCGQHDLPCASIIGVIPAVRNPVDLATMPELRAFTSDVALARYFQEIGHVDGFAKPIGGGQGYGAFPFSVRDGAFVPSKGVTTVEQFHAECSTSRFPGGGYLLQPRLLPHESLRPVMPGPGLGTVRLFSFLSADDEVEIPFAGLRVPAPGATCDNFTYGAIGIPIDVESGVLGAGVGVTQSMPISHSVERHPETGVPFAGRTVPMWSEVLSLVRRAARVFRRLPALGWDVAICPEGPLLIETNWEFGAEFAERLTGCGWAEELRRRYTQLARSESVRAGREGGVEGAP